MASKLSAVRTLFVAFAFALIGLACGDSDQRSEAGRYRVAVLAHSIDSTTIPDPLAVDFDEDGTPDRLVVTDTSLQVALSGGGEFSYTVGGPEGSLPTEITEVSLVSFNRDGRYPSIMLATKREMAEDVTEPILQQSVINDNGRLTLKTLSDYPLIAQGLDCAWYEPTGLPRCFYAGDGARPQFWPAGYRHGHSRLIEFDPKGLWQIAMNSEYLSFRDDLDSQYAPPSLRNGTDARKLTVERLNEPLETVDSILAAGWARVAVSVSDSVRAINFGLSDRHMIYARDLTGESGLPWPVETSMEYDQQSRPDGRFMDGYFMLSSAFVDFSGDGRLDLVVVGLHSGIFSATQDGAGHFVDAGYHGRPDEYYRVTAAKVETDGDISVPPCVYYGMDRDEASKSDYVDCYDLARKQWYALPLPEGSFWMQRTPVQFWDMNGDDMIDFAARKDDGTWTAFTFVKGR